ncbi:aminotransferase class V-fold PLP-dependent enzyme [Saccharopolyspora sp. HNM0983]|uniref:Aminotransferase class V-fold PLP-dependent enzyme n=1 Tax=Saccharopolyspora montiporae TaxID=2781240 RepID=A0A929B7H8_9PSEU|nr:aminotransferase class V-fold PLP-dependent enzyme [Saccharopolyspora sp. HNM0983]MBE9372836.1 aminotransferase class V-fold PLP-dependent enzyme [Saccharopolyspora sp. HNM0983]
MPLSRRSLVAGLGALAPAAVAGSTSAFSSEATPRPPAGAPEAVARDESFWQRVSRQYRVSDDFVNLENGYYGIMSDPVRRTYHDNVDRLNELNSYLLRTTYKPDADRVRARVATAVGGDEDELALTLGGTEALQNLISGYRELRPGDAVMYADLDYPDMQDTMDWLRRRRGVDVVTTTLPEPATKQAVLDTYESALDRHPRTKLLLLSHINNITGLATPVREIVDMARERGVDVIVDAAHSLGQLDFRIEDLGADFVGCSLHKWIGAPLGTGFLYIRRERLDSIEVVFDDESYPPDDIKSRVVSGTRDVASMLSVPAAFDYHDELGGSAIKEARLRYLRNCWVDAVTDVGNVEVLTPPDPAMHGGITGFRITGHTTEEANEAIANDLLDRHGIFVVPKDGPDRGACVRVTPGLYTLREDVDRFGRALRDVAQRFRT